MLNALLKCLKTNGDCRKDKEAKPNKEKKETSLRVYEIQRIYEYGMYRFPKGLTDMGEYMQATEYEDQDGNRLYVGDVVRVHKGDRGSEDAYSIVVRDGFSDTFVMGFASSPIEKMDITKVHNENTILKTYIERDFIISDSYAVNLIKRRLKSLKEYAKLLGDDTDNALKEDMKRSIKVKT